MLRLKDIVFIVNFVKKRKSYVLEGEMLLIII